MSSDNLRAHSVKKIVNEEFVVRVCASVCVFYVIKFHIKCAGLWKYVLYSHMESHTGTHRDEPRLQKLDIKPCN